MRIYNISRKPTQSLMHSNPKEYSLHRKISGVCYLPCYHLSTILEEGRQSSICSSGLIPFKKPVSKITSNLNGELVSRCINSLSGITGRSIMAPNQPNSPRHLLSNAPADDPESGSVCRRIPYHPLVLLLHTSTPN